METPREFVEKVSRALEQTGIPRMAGRIFGWLLVSDPVQASMAELMDALQASKSSISSMTRFLLQFDLLEVVRVPGTRHDAFRLPPDVWTTSLKERLRQAVTFRKLADQGLAVLRDAAPGRRARLQEMRAMYAFLEREIPRLLDSWEKERTALLSAGLTSASATPKRKRG